ncbi:tetratricopeptide repeat protein [Fulvivirgaceae bacterium PWU5]|uniref:histidine kinase n=1 Tax=Dawidia cretensis TaxID=2782350 RepID=A0AAP2E3W3_9BACT|nr:tetratricopeptide repeat protein [Dawidia cretensis]MBT1711603.1 tetratricopeptide repeat protein [Dawidia cretensis]
MYLNFLNFRKLAAIVLLLIVAGNVNGQEQRSARIDSLKSLLPGKSDSEKFDILYDLARALILDSRQREALSYATEAARIGWDQGDSLRIVKGTMLEASALRRLERLDEALKKSEQGLGIARRNGYAAENKILLNSIALIYTLRADYGKALEYNFETLIARERDGVKSEISIALNNIGLVYFKMKHYGKAIEFYTKALDIKREANDTYDLDRLLINLGLCYNQIGGAGVEDFHQSQKYISEALKICADNCSLSILIEAHFGLGVSNFLLGELKEARRHFERSLEISRQDNDKRFQIENMVYLAQVAREENDVKGSELHLRRAEALSSELGYDQLLLDTYRQFAVLYTRRNDFENASLYQNKYIQLKDSVISEELVRNVANIQTDYEERENISIIAAKEQVIKQQSDLNFAIAIIAMLAGMLVLVLQRSNRTIKRVNAQLSEAKETIQAQNELLESKNKYLDKEVEAKTIDLERANQSLKQVNDELDNFIYKTSHDIRGPLASLKGMCNVALLDVKDPVALDYLRKLDTTAERLNTILTRLLIINQINNSKLSISQVDFESIVNDVLMLEKKKGLPQKLVIRKQIDERAMIRSDRELIRIVLENLIDNAIKFYNEAATVESFVEIYILPMDKGYVKMRVVDNGIGISEENPGKLFRMFFRASERSETGGIGLYIVKTATAKLGGRVGLQTTPEGYTEFYVIFPAYPPNLDEGAEKPSI